MGTSLTAVRLNSSTVTGLLGQSAIRYRKVALGTAAAVAIFYLLAACGDILHWGGSTGVKIWADGSWTSAAVLTTLACFWRAGRATRDERIAWLCFTAGCASWLIGQFAWDYFDVTAHFPPSPSVADFGYLALAPLFALGVISLVRDRLSRWLLGLDLLVLALALSVLVVTALWPMVSHSSITVPAQTTALLYPVLYGTLAAGTLLLSDRAPWRSVPLQLLFLGMLGQAIPFILWTPDLLRGGYMEGTIFDPIWTFSLLFVAVAALIDRPLPHPEPQQQVHGSLGLLPLAVASAAGVVRSWAIGYLHVGMTTRVWMTSIMAFVIIVTAARLALTLRRSRELFAAAQSAHREAASAAAALEEKAQRLQTLTEISRVVSGTLDLRRLYDTIYEQIGRVMDASQFFIALLDAERNALRVPYLQEEGVLFLDEEFPFGDNTTSVIISEGMSLLYGNAEEYSAFEQTHSLTTYLVGEKDSNSGIFVPLNTGNRTIGALSVQSLRSNAYNSDDLQILSIIASQAAVAIENARLFGHQQQQLHELQELEEALRSSEERYRAVFERAGIGINLADISGRYVVVNPAFCEMLGYTADELHGMHYAEVTHHADFARDRERFEWIISGQGETYEMEKRYVRKDGEEKWVRLVASAVHDPGGHVRYTLNMAEDITERKRAEEALRASEARYRSLIETSPDAVAVIDPSGTIIMANKATKSLFNLPDGADLTGESVFDVVVVDDVERARESLARRMRHEASSGESTEYLLRRSDGTMFPAEVRSSVYLGQLGTPQGITIVARDITERKKLDEQLTHQAFHDPLTGLPNRALFLDRLQQAVLTGKRDQSPFALLLMDLDRFKEVNDVYGHQHGDLLLRSIAPRLQSALRATDTVARLGGDEFAVLLPGTDEAGAVVVAAKIVATLGEPFTLQGGTVRVGTSVGIVTHPEHGCDQATLLRRADVAMYAAKRARLGFQIYHEILDEAMSERLRLATDLYQALNRRELALEYQPIVKLDSGATMAVEALVRWHHPIRGRILPDVFLPIAEDEGLMTRLTEQILDIALGDCRRWHDAGQDVQVAVNLSPADLDSPHFAKILPAKLREHAIDPSWLALEITERSIMSDIQQALTTLTVLHDVGVAISIDDFGVGFSSLSHLRHLPLDEIKIDKSFVRDAVENERSAKIVRSVIDLSHNLGLRSVAEGISDEATRLLLARMGCDLIQGFHIAEPMPGEALLDWLQAAHIVALTG